MSHRHNKHSYCEHEAQYCDHCDLAYCTKCSVEWGTVCSLNHYPNYFWGNMWYGDTGPTSNSVFTATSMTLSNDAYAVGEPRHDHS